MQVGQVFLRGDMLVQTEWFVVHEESRYLASHGMPEDQVGPVGHCPEHVLVLGDHLGAPEWPEYRLLYHGEVWMMGQSCAHKVFKSLDKISTTVPSDHERTFK